MHYLFFDESYPPSPHPDQKTIIMAAWGVEQDRFRRRMSGESELYNPPVLQRINAMFESLDAIGVLGTATLDTSLFRAGEVDGTDDIPAMARADNIWSQCAIFVVSTVILELLHSKQEVGTVDVYFDPKSLKTKHAEALAKTLRELVVPEARRYAAQRGLRGMKKLHIRRVQPVKKPRANQPADKFQVGTWVADKLCSSAEDTRIGAFPRIRFWDMSDVVKRTVQQFDGKSFYEN